MMIIHIHPIGLSEQKINHKRRLISRNKWWNKLDIFGSTWSPKKTVLMCDYWTINLYNEGEVSNCNWILSKFQDFRKYQFLIVSNSSGIITSLSVDERSEKLSKLRLFISKSLYHMKLTTRNTLLLISLLKTHLGYSIGLPT